MVRFTKEQRLSMNELVEVDLILLPSWSKVDPRVWRAKVGEREATFTSLISTFDSLYQ